MPELPEVETMRRGLLGAVGCRVVSARRTRCRKKPLFFQPAWPWIARRIHQQTISDIGRHGKRLTIRFGQRWTMVIEPRMTGLVLVERPPSQAHLRFEIRLGEGDCQQIRYWDRRGLGRVYLFDRQQLADYLDPRQIGPDALTILPDELKTQLKHRSIPIKVGLLDQKAVAGVGNIYASEILHRAGMDPRTSCRRVSHVQWHRIHRCLTEVMNQAIEFEGSTLSDGTYRNALNDPGAYQNQHLVYDRADEMCLSCEASRIQRIVQSQRSTFYCPRCQARSRRRVARKRTAPAT